MVLCNHLEPVRLIDTRFLYRTACRRERTERRGLYNDKVNVIRSRSLDTQTYRKLLLDVEQTKSLTESFNFVYF